ncbi:unnamed protein product [Camellia sinensis]
MPEDVNCQLNKGSKYYFANQTMTQLNPLDLLNQLEDILDSYPLIDEVGFIHPSQFVTLNEEAGGSLLSSVGTMLQSEDRVLGSRVSKVNPSETVFWCRDHKLGISTQVLLLLYNVAKQTFMAALERYKMHSNLSVKKDEYQSDNMSSWYASSLDVLESEVMKHSRSLLLLSCDFGTAWNSRKLVLSNKQHSQIFVDELLLSALVLSYAPKSECSWSHRWVIKMIDGKSSNLQGIVEKESEIVKKIAEAKIKNELSCMESPMLVSFPYVRRTGAERVEQIQRRLMLRMLEESQHKQDPVSSSSYNAEFRQLWKEELDWNEMLIKQYIGREALWLHRRFLSFCWTKHFVTDIHDISSHSDRKDTMNHEIGVFMDTELELVCSCSTIPDNDYEDFQAQAMFSATYLLWLTKQISEFMGIEFRENTQLLIKPTPRNPPKVVKTHLIKLLNRSCKSGKFNESLYFLECLVKNKGYKPDVILCTKLMQESHGDPDVFAYNALINGFCKLNQIESANQVLNRMRDRGFSPDIITYNIMIGSLCSRGKLRLALKALDQLLDDNCEPTVITYTILIEATVLEGGINEAMKLFDEMLLKGLLPDMYTYNAIVRGLCREGMLDRAFAFVRSLPGKGFKPDVISYNMLLRAILTARKWNDGEKLVTEMYSIGCEPNVVTYSILISSFCREGKIDQAADVLKLMMEKGLSPDTYSYDPLISALCKEGKLDLAIEFIDCMISNGCLPDIVNYNTILSALCKNGNADLAMEIFEKLREIGSCPPDVSSYNTMFSALWNNGDRTQALRMVSEMIEKGIDPDEFTYNSLVSCLCRDGMVDEALELLEDMEGSGFQLTVITYNIVILGLCKAHRINDAIGKLAEMVEKGCRPNETTYVLLIEGIGFAGWRSEAMEMANSLFAMNAISKDSFKRLNKTFPMLDVYKDIVSTGN